MTFSNPDYETDPRSSEELAEVCRAAFARQHYGDNAGFAALHYRGGLQ